MAGRHHRAPSHLCRSNACSSQQHRQTGIPLAQSQAGSGDGCANRIRPHGWYCTLGARGASIVAPWVRATEYWPPIESLALPRSDDGTTRRQWESRWRLSHPHLRSPSPAALGHRSPIRQRLVLNHLDLKRDTVYGAVQRIAHCWRQHSGNRRRRARRPRARRAHPNRRCPPRLTLVASGTNRDGRGFRFDHIPHLQALGLVSAGVSPAVTFAWSRTGSTSPRILHSRRSPSTFAQLRALSVSPQILRRLIPPPGKSEGPLAGVSAGQRPFPTRGGG